MQSATYTKIFLALCWFGKYIYDCRVCNLVHIQKNLPRIMVIQKIYGLFGLTSILRALQVSVQKNSTT